MTPHRVVIIALSAVLPARLRHRYREQWLADLRDCAEAGIAAGAVTFGALRFTLTTNPLEGHAMLPIGPLAIALRHARTGTAQVVVIAVAMAVLVLVGVGLLLT